MAVLILKVTGERNRSSLSVCGGGHQFCVFSESNNSFYFVYDIGTCHFELLFKAFVCFTMCHR